MRTPICDTFGIDYPIFAFTPSEHVAAAVSRAGGLGVLGCVRFNGTEELEELREFLRAHLSGYKLPRSRTVVPQIPRNATGKAQYPKAKEMVLDAHAAV